MLSNALSVSWYVYTSELVADISTTHRTSTLLDAVNNQSVPNALYKSSEANQRSHISNLNLRAVHSVSNQTLV